MSTHVTKLVGTSSESLARLRQYVELLTKWAPVTNLISECDLENVWTRHIDDSLEILRCAPLARNWLDVGSGAGFPGAVIAICLADIPGVLVHLVDSDGRKCVFLREVGRKLNLPIRVHKRRIETLSPSEISPIEIVTTRAFATLGKTLSLVDPFLNKGATAILPRGKTAADDLDELPESRYAYHCTRRESGGGYILSVTRRAHVAPNE